MFDHCCGFVVSLICHLYFSSWILGQTPPYWIWVFSQHRLLLIYAAEDPSQSSAVYWNSSMMLILGCAEQPRNSDFDQKIQIRGTSFLSVSGFKHETKQQLLDQHKRTWWLPKFTDVIYIYIWVNSNDLTATSLESWLIRGNIPKWP